MRVKAGLFVLAIATDGSSNTWQCQPRRRLGEDEILMSKQNYPIPWPIILIVALLFLTGCGGAQKNKSMPAAPPIILEAPADFVVGQRSTTALPGSNGNILLTVDDITAGQVMASLAWRNGSAIIAPRSIRPGDSIDFAAKGHLYRISLAGLHNELLGDDTAKFRLESPAKGKASGDISEENALRPAETALNSSRDAAESSAQRGKQPSEDEKIEALILSLKQLSAASFIRNGQEYSVDEAMDHMRRKWAWQKSEIRTAEDFIRLAGSKSATSEKPYLIRKADGTETTAEEWFGKQLELLNQRELEKEK